MRIDPLRIDDGFFELIRMRLLSYHNIRSCQCQQEQTLRKHQSRTRRNASYYGHIPPYLATKCVNVTHYHDHGYVVRESSYSYSYFGYGFSGSGWDGGGFEGGLGGDWLLSPKVDNPIGFTRCHPLLGAAEQHIVCACIRRRSWVAFLLCIGSLRRNSVHR